MEDLKKCPFCGGESKHKDGNQEGMQGFGWIGCQPCRVFINYRENMTGLKLAIESWNKRN